MGTANGGEDADHGGDGVADEGAAVDVERIEDGDEVVDEGVESGVAGEIEVVGVDTAGANEVVEDDSVVRSEGRVNQLPSGLIGAEAMGENKEAIAGTENPDVKSFQKGVVNHT